MTPTPSMPRAQIERHINSARQLRAETLSAGGTWLTVGLMLAGALGFVRRAAFAAIGAFMLPKT